jgi:hypothetical protein
MTEKMQQRDDLVRGIRPDLALKPSEAGSSEQFQNQTLRPILKLQHPLLVALFRQDIEHRKNAFHALSKPDRLQYIEHTIRTDLKFKNRLLGMLIALFTGSEFEQFRHAEPELTRRATALMIERLQGAYGELI